MKTYDPAFFHKLYGTKKSKVVYYPRDFLDYVLMIVLTALVAVLCYGLLSPMSIIALALCAFALAMFIRRHGVGLAVPVIVRKPREVFYVFLYKLQNLKPMYFIALGLLLLENVLIAATPTLSHHVLLMRKIGLYLFYISFISITAFRTAILIDHLRKRELVREVLMQTTWRRAVKEHTNITLEIVHAYCTGVLTHIILIAPWYLVITYSSFSVVFLPFVCAINMAVHFKWFKANNEWFYRDHWLGHNSEFQFIFLHGTHHDAIPSGLIAVAENGFLEGFMRFTIGSPVTFYNPVISFLVYTVDIKSDIELHQYIPGVFPKMARHLVEGTQHSTHHYGRLEPYSIGVKLEQPEQGLLRFPEELTNSIKLDEILTDFKWDNPTHRAIIDLYDRYHNN